MKADEAPEKLYIDLFKGEFNVSYSPINNFVEYTHTDAFIEKAWEWVENNILSSNQQDEALSYYEQFRNYMKGE